jgi:hypothetical protein
MTPKSCSMKMMRMKNLTTTSYSRQPRVQPPPPTAVLVLAPPQRPPLQQVLAPEVAE